ncbi:3'(2'),5'-bisphosphate nucleotidase [Chromatiales bacterium (ex Bugula neritina AB1)]|nr:3'(2'),5'-bisphosphate nucleotidase [Chromatiales bacterium (ex Bugula neritina AB1)]
MPADAGGDSCRVDAVVELAKLAGSRILELFSPDIEVIQKTDKTPLTAADLAANNIIVEKLRSLDSDIPILTEESSAITRTERSKWDTYWLVDPLDGTREFIKQNGEFSVNIALIQNGVPILGVVHAPVLDITYCACQGIGAWKQVANEAARRIRVRTASARRVTVALGWGNRSGTHLRRFLENLGEHKKLRMGGALKSCLVAEGRADIYACLGPTGEWDTAAAQCIVEEAGGNITDTNMQSLRYNTKDSLLNPHFFVFGNSERRWSDYLG